MLFTGVLFAITAVIHAQITGTVDRLRITAEVDGWIDSTAMYVEYDRETLFNLINGNAVVHCDHGLVEGILQEMNGPGGRRVQIFTEDFGSDSNATSMFEYSGQYFVTQPEPLPPFPETVAAGSRTLQGISVYAHFGNFYFMMDFAGYTGTAAAVSDEVEFLTVLEEKASETGVTFPDRRTALSGHRMTRGYAGISPVVALLSGSDPSTISGFPGMRVRYDAAGRRAGSGARKVWAAGVAVWK